MLSKNLVALLLVSSIYSLHAAASSSSSSHSYGTRSASQRKRQRATVAQTAEQTEWKELYQKVYALRTSGDFIPAIEMLVPFINLSSHAHKPLLVAQGKLQLAIIYKQMGYTFEARILFNQVLTTKKTLGKTKSSARKHVATLGDCTEEDSETEEDEDIDSSMSPSSISATSSTRHRRPLQKQNAMFNIERLLASSDLEAGDKPYIGSASSRRRRRHFRRQDAMILQEEPTGILMSSQRSRHLSSAKKVTFAGLPKRQRRT